MLQQIQSCANTFRSYCTLNILYIFLNTLRKGKSSRSSNDRRIVKQVHSRHTCGVFRPHPREASRSSLQRATSGLSKRNGVPQRVLRRSAFERCNVDRLFPMLLFYRSSIGQFVQIRIKLSRNALYMRYCMTVEYARAETRHDACNTTLCLFSVCIASKSLRFHLTI